MDYEILGSGSSGNAVIINKSIMIDCGLPYKKIQPYVKQLKLVLLTHQHGDHFKPSTVRALHRERPAVRWACCEWMVGPLLEAGVDKRVIDVLTPDCQWYKYRWNNPLLILSVHAVTLPHNVLNCGYTINFGTIVENDLHQECVFYATDCATLDGIEAKNYDYYFIEANHKQEEIEARIAAKRAAGEYAYEMEAMRNHLSQEQAEDWLARNAGTNSKYVFLHQHQDYKGEK